MADDVARVSRRVMLMAPAGLWSGAAGATEGEAQAAMAAFTGGVEPRPGRVAIDIPPLVENGNTVPIAVIAESPMTESDHVRAIAVFNERNPQPHVITVRFSPWSGRAVLSTHMRLATSQRLWAVAAMSDGSFWSDSVQVVVTLAACVEG